MVLKRNVALLETIILDLSRRNTVHIVANSAPTTFDTDPVPVIAAKTSFGHFQKLTCTFWIVFRGPELAASADGIEPTR